MSTAVSPAMTADTRSSSYRAASGETSNLVRDRHSSVIHETEVYALKFVICGPVLAASRARKLYRTTVELC